MHPDNVETIMGATVSRFIILQSASKYGILGFVKRIESNFLIIEVEGYKEKVMEFIECAAKVRSM